MNKCRSQKNMGKLEKALQAIKELENPKAQPLVRVSGVTLTVAVILYLIFVLSVPVYDFKCLLWMGIWVIACAPCMGIDFSLLLKKSLYVLPFIIFIGIFNPLADRRFAFEIFDIPVTYGWISFASLILRGLLCVQAVLLLIRTLGFNNVCLSLRRLGLPAFLIRQMMMVYRYLQVLLEETLEMQRARWSRGYGVKSMSLRMWSRFTGQLFLRSLDRAQRINQAMVCRAYTGEINPGHAPNPKWTWSDTIFLVVSGSLCTVIRIFA